MLLLHLRCDRFRYAQYGPAFSVCLHEVRRDDSTAGSSALEGRALSEQLDWGEFRVFSQVGEGRKRPSTSDLTDTRGFG